VLVFVVNHLDPGDLKNSNGVEEASPKRMPKILKRRINSLALIAGLRGSMRNI